MEEKKITLTMTEQQGQVLLNLLDLANKSGGLQVAESCVFFSRMLQEAGNSIAKSVVTDDKKAK